MCYIYLRSVDWGFGGVHSSRFAALAALEEKGCLAEVRGRLRVLRQIHSIRIRLRRCFMLVEIRTVTIS